MKTATFLALVSMAFSPLFATASDFSGSVYGGGEVGSVQSVTLYTVVGVKRITIQGERSAAIAYGVPTAVGYAAYQLGSKVQGGAQEAVQVLLGLGGAFAGNAISQAMATETGLEFFLKDENENRVISVTTGIDQEALSIGTGDKVYLSRGAGRNRLSKVF